MATYAAETDPRISLRSIRATDCPFRYDDPQGKLTPKGRTSFRWVPNGWPVSTMVRGKFVVRDGELVGNLGAGDYVPREKSKLAVP